MTWGSDMRQFEITTSEVVVVERKYLVEATSEEDARACVIDGNEYGEIIAIDDVRECTINTIEEIE